MNKFLDRYIGGETGAWYFCLEITWGRNIQGGLFHYKQDARDVLLEKIIAFLDSPETLLKKGQSK